MAPRISLALSLLLAPAAVVAADPCAKIGGQQYVAPADARACLSSFPFNQTIKDNVLSVHDKVFNFFTFEAYYLRSPSPFQESTTNIRADLAAIKARKFSSDYEFQMSLYNLTAQLNDGHTRWFPGCYSLIWQNILPTPLSTLADAHGKQSVYVAPDAVEFISQLGTAYTSYYDNTIKFDWRRLAGAQVLKIQGMPAYDYVDLVAKTVSSNYLDHGIRVNSAFTSYRIAANTFSQRLGDIAGPSILDLDALNLELIVKGSKKVEKVTVPYRASYLGAPFTDGASYWAANCAVQPDTNGVDFNANTEANVLAKRADVNVGSVGAAVTPRGPARAAIVESKGPASGVNLPAPYFPTVPLAAGGEGVIRSYILPGNKTGVIFVGSFSPNTSLPNFGFTQFETDIVNSVAAFKKAGVKNLMVDLHNNGGGFVCLGLFLHQYFAGTKFANGYAGFETVQRGNPLAVKIVKANVDMRLNNTFYSPLNWAYLNDTIFPITHNYDNPTVPQTINGQSQPTSQRFHEVCGTFDVDMPANPPWPLDKFAIIGNGNCASTCALFSTLMVERHGTRTLMFGAKPGEQMEYKGMAGNQVLEWADLDSEVKTAHLKNDPLAAPDLIINGNLRHNWRIAYSWKDKSLPIAYKSERANLRFPYTNVTYNQPQKAWEFAASKLF